MSPDLHDPRQNHLLAALPADECASIFADLELVPMPLGETVYEPGIRMGHVYFPTTAIVSLLYVMADGASAEIAVVGNEGIVGVSLFMGGETTTSRAIVQSAGHAYRLRAQVLKEAFFHAGPMQRLLLRYTQALLTQMAQTAVCNRHHSVDQQLCRCGTGGARVRVLRRGQEGVRTPAPGGDGAIGGGRGQAASGRSRTTR